MSSLTSVCESEKKATSVPEINAELINKRIRAIIFTPVIKSIEDNSKYKCSGSGSKREFFS